MSSDKKIELVRLNESAPETLQSENTIGVVDKVCSQTLLGYVLDLGLKNVVQTTAPFVPEELKTADRMLREPKQFLDFPISTILSPEQSGQETEDKLCEMKIPFNSSSNKAEVLEKTHTYVSGLTRLNSLIDDVLLAVDELFTNAIYNAPYMNLANSNVGASRKTPGVTLADGKSAEILIGQQAGRLIVGCRDPFGTLNLHKFMGRFRDCYARGMREMMTFGEGGAGVGGYLVFNMSMSYYVGIETSKQTLICLAFPLGKSASYREEIPKNIHWFCLPEPVRQQEEAA